MAPTLRTATAMTSSTSAREATSVASSGVRNEGLSMMQRRRCASVVQDRISDRHLDFFNFISDIIMF